MPAGDTRVVRAGEAQRRGRTGIPLGGGGFILGVTMPTKANTGHSGALTTYAGTGAGGTLTISTAGATYTDVLFLNTSVAVNAANVTLNNCHILMTTSTAGGVIAYSDNCVNLTLNDCTIENRCQTNTATGWAGHDTTLNRCQIIGWQDAVGPFVSAANVGGEIRTAFRGCYFSELAWFYNPTSGVVHPSDTQTHNDVIQHQGGWGLEVQGCSLFAYYSTAVGTGTPGSGSDAGTSGAVYTQAAGVTARAARPGATMTNPAKSVDGATHEVGGSLSAIMCNTPRGNNPRMNVTNNWFAGGGVQVNARDTALTGSLGTFTGNRHFNDTAFTLSGRSIGYSILTAVTATISGNTWADDNATVGRQST